MKITYEWVKEYCDCKVAPEELAELLTKHGVKVESYQSVNNDTVYELEITANRPDCLSVIGVAREVALASGTKLRVPVLEEDAKYQSAKGLIQIDEPELCPLYIGRIIRGIKVGFSPDWLKKRLESIGLRPVNNIVDITNYVLYETGQPLHTFDLDKLAEKRVIVRRAKPGEKIKAIDDKDYTLSPEILVIADANSPMAIAGIMGGKSSEISYTTKDILLESAVFNPANIRKTSRQLRLASDSSYRFERGINPEGVEWASLRAALLIKELAGGKVTARQEINFIKLKPQKVGLRLSRCEDILSLSIDKAEIKRILKGLGFISKKEYKGMIELVIPPFRPDIKKEIDVIEEIIRVIGYDYVPTIAPSFTPSVSTRHKTDVVGEKVKQIIIASGYNEVLTPSFLDEKYLDDFPLWSQEKALGLLNTEGVEDRFLRKSMLPNLLIIKKTNQGYSDAGDMLNLFEIAKSYYRGNQQPKEKNCLSLLDTKSFYSLKGTLAKIFDELKLSNSIQFVKQDITCFTPTRSLQIKLDGNIVGWLGELSDALVDKYELRQKPVLAELDFELLSEKADLTKVAVDFSRFPAIKRDLALIFDHATEWAEVESVVRQNAPDYLEEVQFFDLYKGKNIPEGKKSLAFSLIFRSHNRTLTNQEVDETVQKVINRLGERFSATLRAT